MAVLNDGTGEQESLISEGRLIDVLEESLAARVIEELQDEVGRYQFTHALIQETLVNELSLNRRVRLHARIALALETLYGVNADEHADELVEHFAVGEPVLGHDKLVKYSLIGGERALGAYAYEQAADIYRRALAVKPREPVDDELAELLFGSARARGRLLEPPDRWWPDLASAFDHFVSVGNRARALAVAAAGNMPTPGHRVPGRLRVTAQAVDLAEEGTAEYVTALSNHALHTAASGGDFELAIKLVDKAVLDSERIGDVNARAAALGSKSIIFGHHMQYVQCAATLEELIQVAGADHRLVWVGPLLYAALGALARGSRVDVERYASLLLENGERHRDRAESLWGHFVLERLGAACGEWDAVSNHRDLIFSILGGDRLQSRTITVLVDVVTSPDEAAVLESALELAALDSAPAEGTPMLRSLASVALASAFMATGDERLLDAARRIAEHVRQLDPSPPTAVRVHALIGTGLLSIAQEDREACAQIYRSLTPYADTVPPIGIYSGHQVLGMLAAAAGDSAAAVVHFEQASVFCRKAGYRPGLAIALADHADVIRRRNSPNDGDQIRRMEEEALALARELGMKPLIQRLIAKKRVLKA
jgi:tetratricopeptide (TPR) repeat protein